MHEITRSDCIAWFAFNAIRCIKNALEFNTIEMDRFDLDCWMVFDHRMDRYCDHNKLKVRKFDLARHRNGRWAFSAPQWLAYVESNIDVIRRIPELRDVAAARDACVSTWERIGALERRLRGDSEDTFARVQSEAGAIWQQLMVDLPDPPPPPRASNTGVG